MKSNKKPVTNTPLFYILAAFAALVVLFLPFIVEKLYYTTAPCEFFEVEYDAKDILSYYGSVLSFIGATILGILTLRQNRKAQEKSDEVNRLQLELQRKSMAMAEALYSQNAASTKAIPKFEISLYGYSGNYANLNLRIKNVSSIIASNICLISFVIQRDDDEVIFNADQSSIKQHSLPPEKETVISTNTPNLVASNGWTRDFYYNLKFVLSFSCEDELSNTHYFRATILIPSTKDFCKDLWKVERVG